MSDTFSGDFAEPTFAPINGPQAFTSGPTDPAMAFASPMLGTNGLTSTNIWQPGNPNFTNIQAPMDSFGSPIEPPNGIAPGWPTVNGQPANMGNLPSTPKPALPVPNDTDPESLGLRGTINPFNPSDTEVPNPHNPSQPLALPPGVTAADVTPQRPTYRGQPLYTIGRDEPSLGDFPDAPRPRVEAGDTYHNIPAADYSTLQPPSDQFTSPSGSTHPLYRPTGGTASSTSAGGGPGGGIGSATPNAYLASQRSRFADELKSDPQLKTRLAAIVDLENPKAGVAVAESLMNRMDYSKGSIRSGTAGGPKSFYGPARNPGMVEARMKELEANPTRMNARMAQIDAALKGSNVTLGHTDQGSSGDPNYGAGGLGVNINGERFNDWGGGPGGHSGAARYRAEQQSHLSGVQSATPAATTAPPAKAAPATPAATTAPPAKAAPTAPDRLTQLKTKLQNTTISQTGMIPGMVAGFLPDSIKNMSLYNAAQNPQFKQYMTPERIQQLGQKIGATPQELQALFPGMHVSSLVPRFPTSSLQSQEWPPITV